jgi:curved DNA-binding protein CbpA
VSSTFNFVGLLGKSTVRIPLDYYRILGLPILATAEQLRQAHQDRVLQIPRPEFSATAVAARKHLLDKAYAVLSEDTQRQEYDSRFLATTYEAESHPPGSASQSPEIEVEESQLIGALLLLQELGEYELVLKLGRPHLNPHHADLSSDSWEDSQEVLADIVLVIASACLELGREEWQQGHYENAAEALSTGQELLLREGLFPGVRAEIQADLFKLRPYRILGMLSDPASDASSRQQALGMLREMLQERKGIDGHGVDQSGLGVDDFLRFIQQLRDHMTVDEQQALFETEARRPSAVATYLAVYALLAKGFVRQEPALIRRANTMLARLAIRQDVYLEQAICALLLGQTEAASKALERSQEYEPLALIREHSQGAPDLLPGLCLYTENWLQSEVFPHFRDLAHQPASLKDYFANSQVQEYLEELPAEPEPAPGQWISSAPRPRPKLAGGPLGQHLHPSYPQALAVDHPGEVPSTSDVAAPASVPPTSPARVQMPLIPSPPEGGHSQPAAVGSDRPNGKPRLTHQRPSLPPRPASRGQGLPTPPRRRRPKGRPPLLPSSRLQLPPWLLPAAAMVLLFLVGFGLLRSLRGGIGNPAAQNAPSDKDLLVQLDQPLIALPEDAQASASVSGELTSATAKRVLELWLSAKKAAMGSTYQAEQLDQILAEPKLSEWRRNSEEAKRDNWHKEYDHALKIENVEVSPTDPNQAKVKANIRELSKYFYNGKLSDSQTDDLQIVYTLVRENGQWKIKGW